MQSQTGVFQLIVDLNVGGTRVVLLNSSVMLKSASPLLLNTSTGAVGNISDNMS